MTDRHASQHPLPEAVEAAVAGGVDWVQLREKDLLGAALCELFAAVATAARRGARARGGEVALLLNRRADVALAGGADGVHLGFDSVDVAAARRLLGPARLVGVSCHEPGEVGSAAAAGASYANLAPIFAPLSKPADAPPLGPGALSAAAAAELPLLAQGGVSAENAGPLLRAGATGLAVTGAILLARDPGAAAAALRAALDDAVD